MNENRFVVQEGHFHIADMHRYVMTGWFSDESVAAAEEPTAGAQGKDVSARGWFMATLDCERLDVQVLCFSDASVRQKYAKYDLKVTTEYVIIATLPNDLSRYRRLFLLSLIHI